MKYKNLFKTMGSALAVALSFTSCSQDESIMEKQVSPSSEAVADGPQVYTLHLDCQAPGYDDEKTRATTTWANGSTIYLRFGSVAGTAVYSSSTGEWTLSVPNSLATTTSETSCQAYYFDNPGQRTSTQVTLTEKTAIYQGTGTYTKPSASDIYVNATLSPLTWRLRFNGSSVLLEGSKSDLNYYSAYNLSSGELTSSKMGDVDLTQSDYVYGTLAKTGDNTIYVQTDAEYHRTIKSSNLQAKQSKYLTAPNSSNYESKDWIPEGPIDYSATIQANLFCPFTDAMVTDFKLGSTAVQFSYQVMDKQTAESYDDDAVVAYVQGQTSYSVADYGDNIFGRWNLNANTEYYLCAVATNSSGVRGPVTRYLFKTLATTLPYAEISNVQLESTKATCDVAMKNLATKYYITAWTSESIYSGNWHWPAYYLFDDIKSGEEDAVDWGSVQWTLNNAVSYFTVCTWAADASGNLGNCQIAYSTSTSSARQVGTAAPASDNETMSRQELQKYGKCVKNTAGAYVVK